MEQKVLGKDQKKQKEKKLINFYSFQMRETKMERKYFFFFCISFAIAPVNLTDFFILDLAQLRKKFEEDKKRISAMKAARKFKPY